MYTIIVSSLKNVNKIETKNTWILLLNNISMTIPYKKINSNTWFVNVIILNNIITTKITYIFILNLHFILKIIYTNFLLNTIIY
jgi:hypothetical protein